MSTRKGSIQDHAAKAAWSFDPDFRHFRLGHLRWRKKMLRISDKGGPYGQPPKRRVVPLSRQLEALLEAYFALKVSAGSLGRARYKRSSNGSQVILHSTRNAGLNLFAGTCKNPIEEN